MSGKALNIGCIFLVTVVVVPAAVLMGYFALGGRTSGSEQWPDYFEIERLVENSDLVVLATFVGEERARAVMVGLEQVGTRVDLRRTYRVVETISGSHPEDSDLVVVHHPISNLGSKFGPASVDEGETYVLFLEEFIQDGEPFWGHTGEPGLARIVQGQLIFLASERYAKELRELGYAIPVEGSTAPFAATLDELRALDSPEQVNP